jgi:hypothetical protein
MGILTNSKELREKILQKNLYKAETAYNLNKDIVSKTLNKAQALGFDLRKSLLLNSLERIVDNTPLVRDSAERLAIEMGRRMADNAVHSVLPSVSINNIFSKRGNKQVFTKNKDYRITPKGEDEKGILGFIKGNIGFRRLKSAEETYIQEFGNIEDQPGGANFYRNLGNGQKELLHKNVDRGFFNPFGQMGTINRKDGVYTIHDSVYSPEFIAERNKINPRYTSYLLNSVGNISVNSDGSSDTFVRQPKDLAETLTRFDATREGFGITALPRDDYSYSPDEERFMYYSNQPESDLTNSKKFGKKNAQRGILYHTQQIAATDTQIGRNIAMETVNYGSGESNEKLFKGASECRSYTMENPYGGTKTIVLNGQNITIDNTGTLMRYKGNGNPNSVLKDSVIPTIYPKKQADLRRMMFSIENLAYSATDMPFIPENQRGPNNGRIMWFAPYGLKVNESVSVDWDETAFLGRIESVYTYSKVSRSAQISFILLIDSPPQAKQLSKSDLAKWFSSCLNETVLPKDTPTSNNVVSTPVPVADTPAPPSFSGEKPKYFFANNDDQIHYINSSGTPDHLKPTGYELTANGAVSNGSGPVDPNNVFALNARLKTNTTPMMDYIIATIGANYKAVIKIIGETSALYNDDYNVTLSYKRAEAMVRYIVAAYNAKTGKGVSVTLKSSPKPIGSLTKNDIDVDFIYETSDGALKFICNGHGEKNADKKGEKIQFVNDKFVKINRNARAESVTFEKLNTGVTPPVQPSIPTPQTISNQKANASINNEKMVDKMLAEMNNKPFANFNDGGLFTKGFDKMQYYKPVYNSQTPYDIQQRYTFLHQCTRPRRTLETAAGGGANSLYGKMPVCVLRLGDFWHSKMIIRNLTFDMSETTWDLNPEGMGVQPMLINVTLDVTLIGGQALEFNVNKLLTANDQNFSANSTYYDEEGFYNQNRWDYVQSVKEGIDGKPEDPTKLIWDKMQELAKKK